MKFKTRVCFRLSLGTRLEYQYEFSTLPVWKDIIPSPDFFAGGYAIFRVLPWMLPILSFILTSSGLF